MVEFSAEHNIGILSSVSPGLFLGPLVNDQLPKS